MKRIITLFLCVTMVLSLLLPIHATEDKPLSQAETVAENLKTLGLFKGVSDTDFALDRAPTRAEALVMLIRLLGKEKEALSLDSSHPFTDVPQWAEGYVAYGYKEGLTKGISEDKFGSENVADKNMYLTFVLRALGYSEGEGKDFIWSSPTSLAEEAGILKYDEIEKGSFLRGDVVLVSLSALDASLKGSETGKTLISKLLSEGAVAEDAYKAVFGEAEEEKPTEEEKPQEEDDPFSFIQPEKEMFVDDMDIYSGSKPYRAMKLLRRFVETNADFYEGTFEYLVYRNKKEGEEADYRLLHDKATGDIHVTYESYPSTGGVYVVRMVLKNSGDLPVTFEYYDSRRASSPVRSATESFDPEDIYHGMSVRYESFDGPANQQRSFEQKAGELIPGVVEFLDAVMKKNFAFYGCGSASVLGFEL